MSTAARARGPESKEALELLLARADDQRPVLDGGLEPESVWSAPKPEALPGRDGIPFLDRRDGDPNDLPAQRWAVVAPLGEEGDAFLRAVEPLVRHRERQQGAPAMCYRVPPDMDAAAAVRWKRQVLRAEDVPEECWRSRGSAEIWTGKPEVAITDQKGDHFHRNHRYPGTTPPDRSM